MLKRLWNIITYRNKAYRKFNKYEVYPLPIDTSNFKKYSYALLKYYMSRYYSYWVVYNFKVMYLSERIPLRDEEIPLKFINSSHTGFSKEYYIKLQLDNNEEINVKVDYNDWWGEKQPYIYIFRDSILSEIDSKVDDYIREGFVSMIEEAWAQALNKSDPQGRLDKMALDIQEIELRKAEEVILQVRRQNENIN